MWHLIYARNYIPFFQIMCSGVYLHIHVIWINISLCILRYHYMLNIKRLWELSHNWIWYLHLYVNLDKHFCVHMFYHYMLNIQDTLVEYSRRYLRPPPIKIEKSWEFVFVEIDSWKTNEYAWHDMTFNNCVLLF